MAVLSHSGLAGKTTVSYQTSKPGFEAVCPASSTLPLFISSGSLPVQWPGALLRTGQLGRSVTPGVTEHASWPLGSNVLGHDEGAWPEKFCLVRAYQFAR